MTRIAVDLPEDIAKRLESAWHELSRGTLEAVALEAYRVGAVLVEDDDFGAQAGAVFTTGADVRRHFFGGPIVTNRKPS